MLPEGYKLNGGRTIVRQSDGSFIEKRTDATPYHAYRSIHATGRHDYRGGFATLEEAVRALG